MTEAEMESKFLKRENNPIQVRISATMQINRDTIIADVERAEAAANKTPSGPVYDEIIEAVAAKHGVGSADVRSIMVDHWQPMGAY